jgi:hypothetical protein
MDVIGGGVLVAAAAALWIAYLLPTWLRRRQYLATERNAVRLQQTLRILAETAETPQAVRVEATAREVVTQQRILPRTSRSPSGGPPKDWRMPHANSWHPYPLRSPSRFPWWPRRRAWRRQRMLSGRDARCVADGRSARCSCSCPCSRSSSA